MVKGSSSSSSKLERKIVERNRRLHVKQLFFNLASHIPTKDSTSQRDQLEQATTYIEQLKDRIKKLKERKELLMSFKGINNDNIIDTAATGSRSPILHLNDLGATLELVLITGLNNKFMFHEVLRVFEGEGAEVVEASVSIVDDRVIHTIHSQVKYSRIGVDISSLQERLKELVY